MTMKPLKPSCKKTCVLTFLLCSDHQSGQKWGHMPNKLSGIVYMHNIFHSAYCKECTFKWKQLLDAVRNTTGFIFVHAKRRKLMVHVAMQKHLNEVTEGHIVFCIFCTEW